MYFNIAGFFFFPLVGGTGVGWGASLVSQLVKNLPAMRKTWV